MKKTLAFFAIAVAAILFPVTFMTSCGNGPDDPDPKDTTVVTPPDVDYEEVTAEDYIATISAYGKTKDGYHFTVQLQDRAILSLFGAIIGGSGDIYTLDIYSTTDDKMIPAMTGYKIGNKTAPFMVKGSANGGSKVKIVDENDDAKLQGIDVNVTEGTVFLEKKGADYRISVNIKLEDGTTRSIAYTGAVSFKDEGPYSKESDEKVTAELTGVQMEISNMGSAVNGQTSVARVQLFAQNGEGELWLLVPKGETNLAHHYEFSDSGEPWTVYASQGAVNGAPSPSYVVLGMQMKFLTGGTLDVTADGMKMNATSYKGSTITFDYKGTIH